MLPELKFSCGETRNKKQETQIIELIREFAFATVLRCCVINDCDILTVSMPIQPREINQIMRHET